MLSLKYDNERLQQVIQQKGINPSAVLSQQNVSDHRLSLGDPAGFGRLTRLISVQLIDMHADNLVLFICRFIITALYF